MTASFNDWRCARTVKSWNVSKRLGRTSHVFVNGMLVVFEGGLNSRLVVSRDLLLRINSLILRMTLGEGVNHSHSGDLKNPSCVTDTRCAMIHLRAPWKAEPSMFSQHTHREAISHALRSVVSRTKHQASFAPNLQE
jgi:hypothetical protein